MIKLFDSCPKWGNHTRFFLFIFKNRYNGNEMRKVHLNANKPVKTW